MLVEVTNTLHLLYVGAWYGVLAIISQMSVITNALLIAITSNFVGFELYIRGNYDDSYNRTIFGREIVPINDGEAYQGLSGYANWSHSVFPVSILINGGAFPAFTAQSLEIFDDDGDDVNGTYGSGNPPLYLPFINFTCLNEMILMNDNCSFVETTSVYVDRYGDGEPELVETFIENEYEKFYNHRQCRELVLNGSSTSEAPTNIGPCFQDVDCRYVHIYMEFNVRVCTYMLFV